MQREIRPSVSGHGCISNFDERWTTMLVLDSPISGPIAGENDVREAEEIKHSNNFAVPGSKLGHQLAAVKRLLRPSHPRKRLPWRCPSQAVLLHRRRHQKLENASVTSDITRLIPLVCSPGT
ncbi:unnamed protein product [Musa banksii]